MKGKWALILIIGVMVAVVGCGAQDQASGVGDASKPTGPTDADLVISRVTAVDCSNQYTNTWYVIGYLENKTAKVCTGKGLSMTLYDAAGDVIGNESNALSPVYPPGRWVASAAISDPTGTPVRGEIKVSGIQWAEIPNDASVFTTTQAGYFPGQYSMGKAVGQFTYAGAVLDAVAVRGILLAADGTPAGMMQQTLNSVSPGTTAFELTGFTPKYPVASVEVYYAIQVPQ